MKWGWVFLGALLSLGTLSWGEKGLEIPEYDGKDRVHDLNAKNYKSVMKKYDVMVIYYHAHVENNKNAQKTFEMEELALEVGPIKGMNGGMEGGWIERMSEVGREQLRVFEMELALKVCPKEHERSEG